MIFKKLKTHTFVFSEEKKTMEIIAHYGKHGGFSVVIDKVRMLSLMRFLIRVMARMATPHRKHDIQK